MCGSHVAGWARNKPALPFHTQHTHSQAPGVCVPLYLPLWLTHTNTHTHTFTQPISVCTSRSCWEVLGVARGVVVSVCWTWRVCWHGVHVIDLHNHFTSCTVLHAHPHTHRIWVDGVSCAKRAARVCVICGSKCVRLRACVCVVCD